MIQKIFYCILASLCFVSITSIAVAQAPGSFSDTAGKRLDILHANRYNFQKLDSLGDFISLAGDVRIKQGKTLFYADSAVLDQKQNIFEAFGDIHINDEDSVHTYSQYLKYYGKEKDAILKNKVKLTDSKSVLTTNELHYNTFTKIGTYVNGGKVVVGKSVLTSGEGIYYGETKDIYFKKKVIMVDPDFRVTTDTLLYNTFTEIARFTVPTKITNKQRTITTSEGFYDMKNKKAVFGKRPFIDDKDYTLTADDLALDEATGFGDALGNAVYKTKDTSNKGNTSMIIANRLQSNSKTSAILATQKPVMIIIQKGDSIYIAADTLYSAKLSDLRQSRQVPNIFEVVADSTTKADTTTLAAIDTTQRKPAISNIASKQPIRTSKTGDTTNLTAKSATPKDSSNNRFVEAYFNVKIFSDSLQAVGDSMFYSFEDSAFRLFKSPVVWAQGNQVTGDTIYLFTANKKPKRLYVFENALAINKVDQFYNQIKGNALNGFFTNGNIDLMKAKGSAENIYYAADEEGKYIGVNRSTADVIDIYFATRKPHKVVFRNNLQGTTSPMNQINHNDLRLRGFKWLEERRPKTKTDLFSN